MANVCDFSLHADPFLVRSKEQNLECFEHRLGKIEVPLVEWKHITLKLRKVQEVIDEVL